MRTITKISLLLGAGLLAACGDDSSDSIKLDLAFGLDTASTSAAAKLAVSAESPEVAIAWEKVQVTINQIKLRADELASSSSEASSSSQGEENSSKMKKFDGIWTLDLLQGTSTPSLSGLELDPGSYGYLQIKSQQGLIEGSNVVLQGKATIGTVTDIPVDVALDLTDVVTLVSKDLLVLEEDTELKATFDADSWFAGLDWSVCYDETAKTLTANEKSSGECGNLVKTLESNIKKGGVLERLSAN